MAAPDHAQQPVPKSLLASEVASTHGHAARRPGNARRAALPRRRAIFVERPVSSMNTSFAGSRSSWPSNDSRRRFRTSGRSCSSACRLLWNGQPPLRASARMAVFGTGEGRAMTSMILGIDPWQEQLQRCGIGCGREGGPAAPHATEDHCGLASKLAPCTVAMEACCGAHLGWLLND